MKNVAYYHAYLDDMCSWSLIFMEQMRCLEKSDLINNLDMIKISAITQLDRRTEIFVDLCSQYKARFEIEFVPNKHKDDHEMLSKLESNSSSDMIIDETYTQHKIYRDSIQSQEDYNILYFHTKNVTSMINALLVPGRVSKYKNRYDCRQYINWGTLLEWQRCVEGLTNNDIAGVNYSTSPSRHFIGGYFWAKSSYVKTLPDPAFIDWWTEYKTRINDEWMNRANNRYRAEQWIGYRDDVSVFNIGNNAGDYIENDI